MCQMLKAIIVLKNGLFIWTSWKLKQASCVIAYFGKVDQAIIRNISQSSIQLMDDYKYIILSTLNSFYSYHFFQGMLVLQKQLIAWVRRLAATITSITDRQ